MKKLNNLTSWAALGLLGTSLTAVSVNAADQDNPAIQRRNRQTISDNTTQISGQNDRTLGQLERANKLIGTQVQSSDNQKLGKIDNLIVDLESGRILYVAVGSGGIAGVGETKRAIAPGAFQQGTGNALRLTMDKAKFETAPEFTKEIEKNAAELGKGSFVNMVYQHCGQRAWWQGGAGTSASEGEFHNVHKATDVIGMKVKSVSDQDMGKIDNLMLNLPQGRIAYAIFDPERSLDLGSDLFALPPNVFTASTDRKFFSADINKEKLAAAPHFAKNNWTQLSDPSFASQVYQYYGKQAYFQASGSLQPTGRENEKNNKTDQTPQK